VLYFHTVKGKKPDPQTHIFGFKCQSYGIAFLNSIAK